jgi:hypothetical protein
VYQKYSSNLLDDREHSRDCPGTRFLNEAKYMTGLLQQDATRQLDRIEILNQERNMIDALEQRTYHFLILRRNSRVLVLTILE